MFLSEQKRRKSFRLLTELYSFLRNSFEELLLQEFGFPSSYGVIFILTKDIPVELQEWVRFPSPYGVSFILILSNLGFSLNSERYVSVSLQSYIHSYHRRQYIG